MSNDDNVMRCVLRIVFKDSKVGPANAVRAAFVQALAMMGPGPEGDLILSAPLNRPELHVYNKLAVPRICAFLQTVESAYDFGDPNQVPVLDRIAVMAKLDAAKVASEEDVVDEGRAAPSLN